MAPERRLIVVGSGAAGMACAVAASRAGASVTVLEAGGVFGGTTAISGGAIWVPANPRAAALGLDDSVEEAGSYLRALAIGDFDEALADAYVRKSAPTIVALEQCSPLRWELQPGWPDYHAELDGGKAEGRTLEIGPVAVDRDALAALRVDPYGVAPMTVNEERSGDAPDASEIRRREDAGILARGRGLVGALHHTLRDLGGEVRLGTRVDELLVSGRSVRGVVAAGERIEGQVALTSGGFERNPQLCHRFLRGPMTAPGGAPSNVGDGLRMGMKLGAALANMSEAWWCPALSVPHETIEGAAFFRMLFLDLAGPGGVVVDSDGRRFGNEAANYNDFGRSLHEFDAARYRFPRVPSWLIFDSRRRLRPVGPLSAQDADPPWLVRDATVTGLARRIGISPERLCETLERFNESALRGVDSDHGRGSYAFDRFSAGTTELHAVREPPFYALSVMPGCLGTKGGLRIDQYGRVLSVDGEPIEGLYAAGNASASPFGCAYPGGGATIGPALVFGWAAGETAAAA